MRLVEGGGTVCGQTGPALVCADDNIMFFILRWPRNMCLTGLSPPALHTVFKVSSPCRRVRRSLRRQKACTRGLHGLLYRDVWTFRVATPKPCPPLPLRPLPVEIGGRVRGSGGLLEFSSDTGTGRDPRKKN